MRLLSKEDVDNEKKQQQAVKVRQVLRIEAQIAKVQNELNDLKDKKIAQKKLLEEDFVNFTQDILKNKNELIQEIKKLEAKRDEALKPLDKMAKDLKEKEVSLFVREKIVQAKEDDAEKERIALENKTDTLTQWHDELQELAAKTDLNEMRVTDQMEFASKSLTGLSQKWEEYRVKEQEFNKKVSDENIRLRTWERSVFIREQKLKRDTDVFNRERAHLNSRQATLKIAKDKLYGTNRTK